MEIVRPGVQGSVARLTVLTGVLALLATVGAGMLNLAATLGISYEAAQKIIDLLLSAWSIWSVIGVILTIVGTGGFGIGILFTAKWLAQKLGAKYAAAW